MAIRAIEVASMLGLNAPPVRHAAVAGAEVWAQGAILISNGSGLLVEGGADPVLIVGVAPYAYPATNVDVANFASYIPAMPHIEFEGTLDDGTGTYALLQTDLWTPYGLVSTSGVWHVDQGETTEDRVVITGLVDPVGTLAGRVRFQFLSAEKIATAPTSNTVYQTAD